MPKPVWLGLPAEFSPGELAYGIQVCTWIKYHSLFSTPLTCPRVPAVSESYGRWLWASVWDMRQVACSHFVLYYLIEYAWVDRYNPWLSYVCIGPPRQEGFNAGGEGGLYIWKEHVCLRRLHLPLMSLLPLSHFSLTSCPSHLIPIFPSFSFLFVVFLLLVFFSLSFFLVFLSRF